MGASVLGITTLVVAIGLVGVMGLVGGLVGEMGLGGVMGLVLMLSMRERALHRTPPVLNGMAADGGGISKNTPRSGESSTGFDQIGLINHYGTTILCRPWHSPEQKKRAT